MKAKTRRRISRALLITGLSLLLIVGVYEAANYPWRVLFANWGWITVEESLPDPKPLPTEAVTPGAESDPTAGENLPTAPGYFTARPVLNVTRLGSIKIPKLGISENVIEGAGDELFYGVGHVVNTAEMGQEGNCVLAGHRNYVIMHPFRHLDKLGVGDAVIVEDGVNSYTYVVYETLVVTPEENWVLKPIEGKSHVLSLLTCTPVLTFTHRMIVRCELVSTTALATA